MASDHEQFDSQNSDSDTAIIDERDALRWHDDGGTVATAGEQWDDRDFPSPTLHIPFPIDHPLFTEDGAPRGPRSPLNHDAHAGAVVTDDGARHGRRVVDGALSSRERFAPDDASSALSPDTAGEGVSSQQTEDRERPAFHIGQGQAKEALCETNGAVSSCSEGAKASSALCGRPHGLQPGGCAQQGAAPLVVDDASRVIKTHADASSSPSSFRSCAGDLSSSAIATVGTEADANRPPLPRHGAAGEAAVQVLVTALMAVLSILSQGRTK